MVILRRGKKKEEDDGHTCFHIHTQANVPKKKKEKLYLRSSPNPQSTILFPHRRVPYITYNFCDV